MSEFTDSLITQHLGRHQDRWEDYLKDSAFHHETELLRRLLETTERAMEREGIPAEVRHRVLETIVFGDPDAAPRMTRDEARDLLLTRFEPSASECTINQVFTEPGPGAAQLTDGTPEQLAAWLEKKQARLIESTGFDLRVPPDGDDGPERPASGEEKTT